MKTVVILFILLLSFGCSEDIAVVPAIQYQDGIGLYFPFSEEPRIHHYLRCTEVREVGQVVYYFETGSDSSRIEKTHIRQFWPDPK